MVVSLLARAHAGAKSLLALIGVAGLGGLLLLPLHGDGARSHRVWAEDASFEPKVVASGAIDLLPDTQLVREQRVITEFIAKRYRVSDTAVASYVAVAYRAGEQYSVDPLLILAVMAVESRYNPVAESLVGAKGLMQVIPKYHLDKLAELGGEDALLEPEVNIQVGAQILREYQRRCRDTEAALQMYAGAFDEPSGQYSSKVFAERARLEFLRQKVRKPQSV
ncbi:MAG TPA: transglycosylase SLT domain-containing protein [Burkholderiales bacterium]|jgi:soluble lytic murein transglycosylase-like protein|nr:transglycosylase SLT domain-containing protein [Burkholderiales bacterium]